MNSRIQNMLSRRNLLRNAALLTLVAPVVRRIESAEAQVASPRRVILIFSPNGPMNTMGPASGSETDFALQDWWKPLDRHQADGIFLSHTASTGAGTVTGGGHGLGGQTFSGYGAGANNDQYANKGQTIDQVLGKRLEAEGRAGLKRSLVWGNYQAAQAGGTGDAFCADYGRNIRPETDVQAAWSELFAGFMAPDASDEAKARAAFLMKREQSVLDFVHQDCQLLRGDLGAEGARLLDDHCQTVRAMEQNLVNTLKTGGMCAAPPDPGKLDWAKPENIETQSDAFIELMTATLACEMSHVIAFQFGAQGARNRLPESYGVPSSPTADSGDSGPAHHPWTHQGASDTKNLALSIFYKFYSTQVAKLVDKLKSTNDAAGNPLFDSTVVLWLSELGGNEANKDNHQTSSIPTVMFGNGQGTFKTGRYLKGKSPDVGGGGDYVEAGRDAARHLVSIVQYMGLTDVNTVGETQVNGPLTSLYG